MRHSIELLQKALEKQTLSAWARDFNVVPSTFTNAKRVGRLSPALAGNLAIELGEDPRDWIAIAAIEAEKDSPLLQRLKAREISTAEAVRFELTEDSHPRRFSRPVP